MSDLVASRKWIRAAAMVAFSTLIGVGCSSGGSSASAPSAALLARPSSTGHLTIVSPLDGQVFRGTDVPVRVDLSGARIVPATTAAISPNQGHLHLTLDGEIVSMNFGVSAELRNVSPGIHVVQVEFVASDHLPFDPRVIKQVTFEVRR